MNYQVGDYLLHPNFGVGRITQVGEGKNPDLVLKYPDEKSRTIPSQMADDSYRKLTPDGFLALWFEDAETANKILDEKPARAIGMALRDYPSTRAKTEEIKDYLKVAFGNRDWNKWWKKTHPALKRAEFIDTSKSEEREYRLREEGVSLAEESFQRFQFSLNINGKRAAYEDSIAVFNAVDKGAALSEPHQKILVKFYLEIQNDPAFNINKRLDAIYRLVEIKWLATEQARDAVQALIREGLVLYRLDTFAQNRLINFLISNDGIPEFQTVLLTGMCADSSTVDQIAQWITRRGDPEIVATAIKIALSENTPPGLPAANYASLANRLDKCESLVGLLASAPASLPELVDVFDNLCKSIGSTKQFDAFSDRVVQSLTKFASTLRTRFRATQPELAQRLVESLADPDYSSEFLQRVLAAKTISANVDLVAEVEKHLLANPYLKDDLLLTFLNPKGKNPLAVITHLAEIAQNYGKRSGHLLGLVCETAVTVCRTVKEPDLVPMLAALDSISQLDGDSSWKSALDSFRQRGYSFALSELIRTSSVLEKSVGVLDHAILSAIQDSISANSKRLQLQIESLLEKIEEQANEHQEMKGELTDTQGRMGELRQGIMQDPQKYRYEERVRILREFAESVAEFERFNSKPDRKSPDVDGIIRRLNSLLAAQGVIPRETIGALIAFDPSYCQFVTNTGNSKGGEQVQVVERGYMIKDPQGSMSLLKPVLVRE